LAFDDLFSVIPIGESFYPTPDAPVKLSARGAIPPDEIDLEPGQQRRIVATAVRMSA